jgi:hypothetical protein
VDLHVSSKNVHQVLIHSLDMEMKLAEIVLEEDSVIMRMGYARAIPGSLDIVANINKWSSNQ